MINKKYPALRSIIEADMANITPDEHQFGIDVTLNITQPGERKYKHGPRVKIFRENPDINFSVALNKDFKEPKIIGNPYKVIRRKDLAPLLQEIQKYRIPFLMFWYDRTMSTSKLLKLMQRSDNGESLEKELEALLDKNRLTPSA